MSVSKHKAFVRAGVASLCLFLLCKTIAVSDVWGATTPGTVISNMAEVKYKDTNGNIVTVPSNKADLAVRSPSKIEIMEYAPSFAQAEWLKVSTTEYQDTAGKWWSMPAPKPLDASSPLDMSKPWPLMKADKLYGNDTLFVRLTDLDQNVSHDKAESVVITLKIASTDEAETLRLWETGPNTGVFMGYIKSESGETQGNNGTLNYSKGNGAKITSSYVDVYDGTDATTDLSLLVDPFGVIFDSSNGQPVNGVEMTLLNSLTGQPAKVFGDDGVSAYPSKMTSGTAVTDSGGKVYTFAPGEYRFPLVEPSKYRLVISPPAGFKAPSTVSLDVLQSVPGGPFVLDDTASRGGEFTVVAGPALRFDIPVDPVLTALFVTKSASKSVVSIGDFLQYKLTVESTSSTVNIPGVSVNDALPSGFRYRKDSLKVNGVSAPDPAISGDGRNLTITIGDLLPGEKKDILYVVEISAGANKGKAVNTATASGTGGTTSNSATATVEVKEPFFTDKGFIAGSVLANGCGGKKEKKVKGVEGVRIYLEDGAYVLTDKNGMYHFQGVNPGTHVVQLDLTTIPKNYQVIFCEKNNRFADNPYSQFADIRGGTLWRADFYLSEMNQADIHEETPDDNKTISTPPPGTKTMPSFDNTWLDATEPGFEWLWPPDGFHPSIPSIKIAVKHDPVKKLKLLLNQQEVDPLYYDGGMKRKDGKIAVSFWSAVHLVDGDNVLEAVEYNEDSSENRRLKQTIHYSDIPVKVELIPGQSVLIADGKTPPVIAVRLTDKDSHPAREGDIGEFSVEPPYMPKQKEEEWQKAPLTTTQMGGASYQMGENGMAFIELQPTSKTGELVVRFSLANDTHEIRVWLNPEKRDWLLVGVADGTLGYDTLSENMEGLGSLSDTEDKWYKDGRIAFFVKGTVKGKWLLTLAYESAKKWKKDTSSLHQTIDPDTYYTVYGDASEQQYDAASSKPLYIKIEREKFYALFGDYETGLTVTELSRYSRNFTGFKSEMKDEKHGFNVFVADTNQKYVKDEIRGDGTSGLYKLSRKNIVLNSESVAIETRDRFHSETVLASRKLSRHIDYNIDYEDGTIYFKAPVSSKDENFDPIFIVAEYETMDLSDYNYGGRGSVKLLDNKLETGVTYIHEGKVGGKGNLAGMDTVLKLSNQTKLKTEFAATDTDLLDGSAYIAELSNKSALFEGKLYIREQDNNFGFGQQKGSESGTKKYGLGFNYRLSDLLSMSTDAYKSRNLSTDAVRTAVGVDVKYAKQKYDLITGLQYAEDNFTNGTENTSEQLVVGGNFRMLHDRMILRTRHNQSISGQNKNTDFPTRTLLGADYKLRNNTTLFGEQEFTWGALQDTEATRLGMKVSPWSGSEISSTFERQYNENGTRLFSVLGLNQTWALTKKWTIDAGLDRSYTLTNNNAQRFNVNVPESSGGADFTAVSVGASFQEKLWSWTGRVEIKDSKTEDKAGVSSSVYGEPKKGLGTSFGLQLFKSEFASGSTKTDGKISLGLAYRPELSKWIILDRLEYIFEKQNNSDFNFNNWRLVNNFNANYKLSGKMRLAMLYGAKYVGETIDAHDYKGYTDLIGLEPRYDLTKKWGIGTRSLMLHSWDANQFKYTHDLSLGYNLAKNMWLSIGYNWAGFNDRDFSRADFTNDGPFFKFRLKFDQRSFKDEAKQLQVNEKEPPVTEELTTKEEIKPDIVSKELSAIATEEKPENLSEKTINDVKPLTVNDEKPSKVKSEKPSKKKKKSKLKKKQLSKKKHRQKKFSYGEIKIQLSDLKVKGK